MNGSQNGPHTLRASRECMLFVLALVLLASLCTTPVVALLSADTTRVAYASWEERAEEEAQVTGGGKVDFDKLGVPAYELKTLFVDETSGAKLYYRVAKAADDSPSEETISLPYIERLDVQRGEECLHEEGTCKACDELREMYRNGEVDALYRVTITPEVYSSEQFSLSVPLDTKVEQYASYRCDGGKLKPSYMHVTAKVAEKGFTSASIECDLSALQSPFGIAYNKSKPEESSAPAANASTPNDADGDRAERPASPINIVTVAAFLAVVGGACCLIGLIWVKSKHPTTLR